MKKLIDSEKKVKKISLRLTKSMFDEIKRRGYTLQSVFEYGFKKMMEEKQ